MRLVLTVFVAMLLFAGCSGPSVGESGARSALEEAAQAMGGWEALGEVRAQRIVSRGSDWEPMQAMSPAETRQTSSFSSVSAVDFASNSLRMEVDTQLLFPRERSDAYVQVIQGDLGMLERAGAAGTVTQDRLHGSVYATRLRDLRRLPIRVLVTAKEAEGLDRLPDLASEGKLLQILQFRDGGQEVELRMDAATHLPVSVAYLEDDVNFGDVRNEWVWSDWKEVGGVSLPFNQEHRLNEHVIQRKEIQEVENNPSLAASTFSIPEEIGLEPEVGERVIDQWPLRRVAMGVSYLNFATPQSASLEPLAEGVWLATGAGHQTLVVEMEDHLMVFEAPLFEERSQAVISAIGEKFSDKPIRTVMVTHFHIDHTGGIRAYAAEGATILAHSNIIPFLEATLEVPKTIRPDSLARLQAAGSSPQTALEGIDAMKEYTDGSRVVTIHPIANPHVRDMLGVYLPNEKMTFTADLVSSAAAPNQIEDRARAYYDFVKERNLTVDRIVRVHGPPLSFGEFAAKVEGAQ